MSLAIGSFDPVHHRGCWYPVFVGGDLHERVDEGCKFGGRDLEVGREE